MAKEETAEGTSVEGDEAPAGSQPQKATEDEVDPADALDRMTGEEPEPEAEKAEEEPEGEPEEEEPEDEEKPQGRRNEKAERRISELTAARKAAEERADAAEARAKELAAKADGGVGLHPDYVSAEEMALLTRANELEGREEFLLKNWDGYEDERDEKKNLTAAQVREEYVAVRKEARTTVGRANALYEERKRQQLEDMREGRRIRLEREKLKAAPGAKPKAGVTKAPPAPPRATTAEPPVKEGTRKRGMSVERFEKAGATREAAARELSELTGDV